MCTRSLTLMVIAGVNSCVLWQWCFCSGLWKIIKHVMPMVLQGPCRAWQQSLRQYVLPTGQSRNDSFGVQSDGCFSYLSLALEPDECSLILLSVTLGLHPRKRSESRWGELCLCPPRDEALVIITACQTESSPLRGISSRPGRASSWECLFSNTYALPWSSDFEGNFSAESVPVCAS